MRHQEQDSIQVVFVVTGNSSASRRLSDIRQNCSQSGLPPPILVHASDGAGKAIATALASAPKAPYVAVIFDDVDMPTGWLELVKAQVSRCDIGVLGFASVRPRSNGSLHDFGYELVRLPYGCATRALGVGADPDQFGDDVIECDVVGGCAIVVNQQLCDDLGDVRRTNRWPELILCLAAKRRELPVVALGRATFHEGSASKSSSVEEASPSWLIERVAWDREVAHLLCCDHLRLTSIDLSDRLRQELRVDRRCALVGAGVAAWSISGAAEQAGAQTRVFSGLDEEIGLQLRGVAIESLDDLLCEAFDVVFDTTPVGSYDFPTSWNLKRSVIRSSAGMLLVDLAQESL